MTWWVPGHLDLRITVSSSSILHTQRSYIRDVRIPPRLGDLIKMAMDVANGMAYLEYNKVVHRDLAARNCLLDDHLNVRVSDFGLSRDVYQTDYYRANKTATDMPVRWMAPECIEFHQFSSKSDVWSYAVLVWELMTRGKIPYATVNTWEIGTILKCGIRLEKPETCPDFLYKLMTSCWSRDPDQRPTFADLVKLIAAGVERMEAEGDSESRQAEGEYENEMQ